MTEYSIFHFCFMLTGHGQKLLKGFHKMQARNYNHFSICLETDIDLWTKCMCPRYVFFFKRDFFPLLAFVSSRFNKTDINRQQEEMNESDVRKLRSHFAIISHCFPVALMFTLAW